MKIVGKGHIMEARGEALEVETRSQPVDQLTTSDDVKQVLDYLRQQLDPMLRELITELKADALTLFLYDATTKQFELPIGYGLYDRTTFGDPLMRPRMDRVAGKIVRERVHYIVERVAGHPFMDGPFARRERIVSAAGFPLIHEDAVLGVVFINYRSAHSFTKSDLQTIGTVAQRVAATIAQTDVLTRLLQRHPALQCMEEQTLQAFISLTRNIMKMPISIWLLEPQSQSLRIRAHAGLIHDYATEASAHMGDGSIISQVVKTGKVQIIHDLQGDGRFHYSEYARRAGWVSLLGFPITLRRQTRGVIEVFTFQPYDFNQDELWRLQCLANMASVAIENTAHVHEAKQLAKVARTLSITPDFNRAMRVIVESARELTGADASAIVLLAKQHHSFAIGSYASERKAVPADFLCSREHLTQYLIETDKAIKIDDTRLDPRIDKTVVHQGVLSLIGVRVQMESERIGVLYVDGRRKDQFTMHDVDLLQMLADQASVALGWSRLLLKPAVEIEQACSNLFRLEDILKEVCWEIQSSLGFEYAAVQLIRPEEDVIETVYGTGVAQDLSVLSKRYLEKDPKLRDIQADIALKGRTEIIAGWDNRFDRWIYDTFHHERLVRVFTPLVLVRDANGEIVDDWFENCSWEVVEQESDGRRTVIEMYLPNYPKPAERTIEIIGTIEAGYHDPQVCIESERAIALATCVARQALRIRQALLPYVLETIVEHARRIIRADSASLHFLYAPLRGRYIYETCSGSNSLRSFLKTHPPRENGLGRQSIQERRPKFVPDASQGHTDFELRKINPEIFFKEGVVARAAFPLLVDDKEGVLYVHFRTRHRFTENEIGWLTLLAQQGVAAIQHATAYTQTRDKTRQLAALHKLGEYLGAPLESDLLYHSAWKTLHTLAADSVIIYEYSKAEEQFYTPPVIAGRLREPEAMGRGIQSCDAPALLVRNGESIYAERSAESAILNNPNGQRPPDRTVPSVIREGIESTAGILLKAGEETVGVMFVNYRRSHVFSEEEKQLFDILGSSLAIAIKNQRLLEALRAREIRRGVEIAWREFSATTAHRMGTEAADIAGALDRLKDSLGESTQTKDVPSLLSRIDNAINRIKVAVHEFTEFAKPPEYKFETIDLNSLLQDVKNSLSVQGAEKIAITWELTGSVTQARCDWEKIFYAFTEIIRNAIIAMPSGGKLNVVTNVLMEETQGTAQLQVVCMDTGPGIPEYLKEKIFESGFKNRPGGMGLGLAIVKRTIKDHGGCIREVGTPGKGAHFIVELPLIIASAEDRET